ncbi:MAG: hypothetical protein HC820_01765 [Hydrococcus sp. RM1_1_31]|nr:hypothetical protein [Hydrococcus sp. RM1_1_31]
MSHKQQIEQVLEGMGAFVRPDIKEEIFRYYSVAVVLGLVIPYFAYLKLSASYKRHQS